MGSSSHEGISVSIPHDLTTGILLRLPAKSLARFLCVSKLWTSTIRSRNFIDSFMTRSSARPYLVFNLSNIDMKHFFFSSSDPEQDISSPQTAHYDVTFPKYQTATMYQSVRGLVCFGPRPGFLVCNPSTRRSITLPEIESVIKGQHEDAFFGYDPIKDQYKALWVTSPETQRSDNQIRVFALGDKEWRRIQGPCPLHFPSSLGTCINGVIYYAARRQNSIQSEHTIVSFEVQSEKFNLIKAPQAYFTSPLINYEGKLAVAGHHLGTNTFSFYLWILKDAEKEEWSRKVFALPPSWRNEVLSTRISCFEVCTTTGNDAGEIVLTPIELHNPFYIMYYNPKRNTLRRVLIEGITHRDLTQQRLSRVWTFPNHIESIMFL